MEEENNGRLPFLDVMVERHYDNLSFDVYRKPTSTKRYITTNSFHPQSHKDAAFHSMAHRLCNFHLSEENYVKEKENIVEIGRLNGYNPQRINKIIKKQKSDTGEISPLWTFQNQHNEDEFQYLFIRP